MHICIHVFNAEVIGSSFISASSDHRKVIFEKQWIYLDNAVGRFYRTTFEIGSGGTLLLKMPKETESSTGVCNCHALRHHANYNYVGIEEVIPKNFTNRLNSPPILCSGKGGRRRQQKHRR